MMVVEVDSKETKTTSQSQQQEGVLQLLELGGRSTTTSTSNAPSSRDTTNTTSTTTITTSIADATTNNAVVVDDILDEKKMTSMYYSNYNYDGTSTRNNTKENGQKPSSNAAIITSYQQQQQQQQPHNNDTTSKKKGAREEDNPGVAPIHNTSVIVDETDDKYDGFTDEELDINDAIERLGMGIFQYKILLAAGLCFAADSMEVLLLSFLAIILKVEWNLTPHETDSIISVVFLGALLGTVTLGPMSDKIGRKPIFTITAIIIAIAGLGTAIVENYHTLLLARFIVGFGVGGLIIPFDTLAEFIPTTYRGQNLLYIEFFWTFGTLMVPIVAWYSLGTGSSTSSQDNSLLDESWRIFVALCSIPCILSTILGILYVPESPHWLVCQGKCDKALHILRHAAKCNGLDPLKVYPIGTRIKSQLQQKQDLLVDEVNTKTTPLQYQQYQQQQHYTYDNSSSSNSHDEIYVHEYGKELRELFSPRWINTTLTLWCVWFVFGILYYGVIIVVSIVFSVHDEIPVVQDEKNEGGGNNGNNGGSTTHYNNNYDFDYSAIIISASSEIFGLILVLLTIDKYGRIKSQVVTYMLGGLICFILGFLASTSSSISGGGNKNYTTTNGGQYYDVYDDEDAVNNYSRRRNTLLFFAFVARMLMMGSTCTTWVSTSEILTTDIRGTGHAAANAMARLGGFICPYIINEETNMQTIGTFLLILGCIAAYSSSKLPETMGKSLGSSHGSSGSSRSGNSTGKGSSSHLLLEAATLKYGGENDGCGQQYGGSKQEGMMNTTTTGSCKTLPDSNNTNGIGIYRAFDA